MWLRTLFDCLKPGRSRTPVQPLRRGDRHSRRPGTCRLAVEALEDRCVPAAPAFLPSLSVGSAVVAEGNSGTTNAVVQVRLSAPSSQTVTVNYSTADGTAATAGSDYLAVSGKLTFAPGETSKSVQVAVVGDRIGEPDEYFFINLGGAKNAKIAERHGIVTIVGDEPRIWINDVSPLEGNSGTTAFTFTVSLSAAYDLPVTVNYATSDGSASAGSDYTAASGTLTFSPGQTSQTITVLVNGDRLAGPDKTFFVNVSTPNSYAMISRAAGVGTIIDAEPWISIGDAYNYGDYSPFTFTVSLSAPSDEVVTVDFTTVDGTALAGLDYVFTSGTLTFAPGVTSMTITVDVLDPTYADWTNYKYFTVHLSNASTNALIGIEGAAGWFPLDPSIAAMCQFWDCS